MLHLPFVVCTSSPSTTSTPTAGSRPRLLAHPVLQGALVMIRPLWALKMTEPPQRAVTMLAAPATSAVLASLALTQLPIPAALALLLLVALAVLKKSPA